MTEILYFLIGLGPYFLVALGLGLGLGLGAPWLLKHPERWLWFAIFGLSLLPFGGGGGDSEGSLYRQLTWGGLFLFAAFHALRDGQGRISYPKGRVPLSLTLLVAYVLLSVVWSPDHLLSLKRAVQIVGVVLIALAIAHDKTKVDAMLNQLATPAGVFIVLGGLVAVMAPGMAFDVDHALRAISSHKNTWGQFSLLASLTFFSMLFRGGQRRWLMWVALGFGIISLLLSRSTTSLLAFAIISIIALTWWLVARGGVVGKVVLFATVLAIALGLHGYTVMSGELPLEKLEMMLYKLTGKTPSLTGRTYLWQLMMLEIQQHPWFGIGYGGFWTQMWDSPATAVIQRLTWGPPTQAHNGYIDVVNELGLVGAGLLLIVLIQHAVKIVGLYRAGWHDMAAFHMAVFLSALIINYAESSFLRTTHMWWILLCVSVVTVHALTVNRRFKQNASYGAETTPPQGMLTPG